jgi:hypothetical protein
MTPSNTAASPLAMSTGFGSIATALAGPSVDLAACLRGTGQAGCMTQARVATAGATAAPASIPGAPGNLVATAAGGTVTLSWTAPASADPVLAYVIEAGSFPGAANLANFSTGSPATVFTASGVGAGIYYVRVRAATAAGAGPASNEATLVVSAGCVTPGPPGGLSIVSVSGGTVVLAWLAAANGPTSYVVEAGSGPGQTNLVSSDVGASTTLTAAGVGAGTYYVRMRARNACGVSGPSNEVVVTVGAATVSNVSGTWSLTRTGTAAWIRTYSTFTVTLVQSGVNLTGSIRPTASSRSTSIILGNVSSGGVVFFGSEHAYWNDDDDGYFRLSLDSTGRRMTGGCSNGFTCSSATATKISP